MSFELDNKSLFAELKFKYNLQEIVFAGHRYLQYTKTSSDKFNLINTTRNPSIIKLYNYTIYGSSTILNEIILPSDEECSIYNLEKINKAINNSIYTINKYFLLQKQKKLKQKFQDIDDDFT